MSTSGQSRFELDIADIIDEAFDRIGREARTGYDLIMARRSLNILFQELMNMGVNLWTIELCELELDAGTGNYVLDYDTSDVLPEAVIRQDGRDVGITRFMREDWLALPNKSIDGRPVNFLIERKRDAPEVTFYPVPDDAYTFVYWRIRYLEDVTAGDETADLPRRFLPAVISGLAYHLANKAPEIVPIDRRQELKAAFKEDIQLAMEEDEERGSIYLLPSLRR